MERSPCVSQGSHPLEGARPIVPDLRGSVAELSVTDASREPLSVMELD